MFWAGIAVASFATMIFLAIGLSVYASSISWRALRLNAGDERTRLERKEKTLSRLGALCIILIVVSFLIVLWVGALGSTLVTP